LIVLLDAPLAAAAGQPVTIQGSLTTLPNGLRAVTQSSVTGFTDARGSLILAPFPVKTPEDELLLPGAMVDITPLPLLSTQSLRIMTVPELPTIEEEEDPPAETVPANSIAAAKLEADSTEVTVTGKVVSTVIVPGVYYIQEPDRACGIRVQD